MNYETTVTRNDDVLTVERPSRRRAFIIAAVVAALALLAFVLFGRGGGEEATPATATAPGAAPKEGGRPGAQPRVTVIVPGRQSVARQISSTGTLAARRELPVGVVGEGGVVTRVFVEAGDWVRQGQVLASVDRQVQAQQSDALDAQVGVARADARLAQQELDRSQQLVGRGFISQADVDRRTATRDAANARVRVAEAQARENRARIGRLDIRAPAAGLVLTRGVEPGQVIGAGSGVLFRIARGGEMELRAQLAEGDLAGLSVGQSATVTPVGRSESFEGQIWQLAPVIDPTSRQGIARIALSYDPALRPGGFASAIIQGGGVTAPLLPESAVLSDTEGNYVYIIDGDNKAQRRAVTIGGVSDRGITITSGLNGQERVVQSAGPFLTPGQTVNPVRAAAR
ncbi:RND family efflux transporter MFP subunit [Sphingomonas jejuensis]|uniref:RND family efflux transporter MFP subunit n=1 Tax=Sphingomonas jejuensis TaxID=904715 RepID=A0ABX0XPG6_9SPHN|nr:efflux RND transporter periplasmic adaptor subunit [Sphingomonas jejuensis]NJC35108.1 RND family efflux transporter MFP subunit [Sphingomonas jejuensis]